MAEGAAHSFEAYTQLGRLLKHERWLIASNATNEILFAHLRRRGGLGESANVYIDRRNRESPYWLNDLVMAETKRRGWLIPQTMLTRRFASLLNKPMGRALLLLPIVIAAFVV